MIRKTPSRGATYIGTWSIPAVDTSRINGFSAQTSTATDFVEYTFWGTGFDFRFAANTSSDFTMSVDGSSNLSSFTTSFYDSGGTAGFTAATGNYLQGATGSTSGNTNGIVVDGLSLGTHTIKVVLNAVFVAVESFDIITPIHISDSSRPGYQNDREMGHSVGDLRRTNFEELEVVQTFFFTGLPSSTTSTAFVPAPGSGGIVVLDEASWVEINVTAHMRNLTGGQDVQADIFVDGKELTGLTLLHTQQAVISGDSHSIEKRAFLSKGSHFIQVYHLVSGGTADDTKYDVEVNVLGEK
jgi:hypothetical protein